MSAKRAGCSLCSSGTRDRKKQRKSVTLGTKLEVLKRSESGQRSVDIAKALNLPATTVRTIRLNAEKIRSSARGVTPLAAKRVTRTRSSVMENMERLLSIWLEEMQQHNRPCSLAAIRTKALSLFQELKKKEGSTETFAASRGWFERFKKRSKLRNMQLVGDTAGADEEAAFAHRALLRRLVAGRGNPRQPVLKEARKSLRKGKPIRTYVVEKDAEEETCTMTLCEQFTGQEHPKKSEKPHQEFGNGQAFSTPPMNAASGPTTGAPGTVAPLCRLADREDLGVVPSSARRRPRERLISSWSNNLAADCTAMTTATASGKSSSFSSNVPEETTKVAEHRNEASPDNPPGGESLLVNEKIDVLISNQGNQPSKRAVAITAVRKVVQELRKRAAAASHIERVVVSHTAGNALPHWDTTMASGLADQFNENCERLSFAHGGVGVTRDQNATDSLALGTFAAESSSGDINAMEPAREGTRRTVEPKNLRSFDENEAEREGLQVEHAKEEQDVVAGPANTAPHKIRSKRGPQRRRTRCR